MRESMELENYCQECKKSYKDLRNHFVDVHIDRERNCPFCEDVEFRKCASVMQHVRQQHGIQMGRLHTNHLTQSLPRIQGSDLRQLLAKYVVLPDDLLIIPKTNFVLGFNHDKKTALFSFETKTKSCLQRGENITRDESSYRSHKALGRNQMFPSHMNVMGYAAGHLIPVQFNQECQNDMDDTFIYPNLVPMNNATNVGMWFSTEYLVKYFFCSESIWTRVHILSGPIITERNRKRSIGCVDYYVPEELFKVYILENKDRDISLLLCFIIPNDGTFGNIYHRMCNLHTIEEKTTIRFTEYAMNIKLTTDPTILNDASFCKRCHKVYLTFQEMLEHLATHDGEYVCTSCHISFNTKAERDVHIEAKHSTHACSICKRTFDCQSKLNYHLMTHHDERPEECTHPGCNSRFRNKRDLRDHLRTHTGEKPFVCPYCDSKFTQIQQMNDHIKWVHRQLGLQSLTKKVGNYGAKTKTSASSTKVRAAKNQENVSAIRNAILKDKPFFCDHKGCNRRFQTKEKYDSHRAVHSQERKYICTIEGCNKRFRTKDDLNTHMRKERGEKPYACKLCNYRCSYSSNLSRHNRKNHANSSAGATSLASASSTENQVETSSSTQSPEVIIIDSDDDFQVPPPL